MRNSRYAWLRSRSREFTRDLQYQDSFISRAEYEGRGGGFKNDGKKKTKKKKFGLTLSISRYKIRGTGNLYIIIIIDYSRKICSIKDPNMPGHL